MLLGGKTLRLAIGIEFGCSLVERNVFCSLFKVDGGFSMLSYSSGKKGDGVVFGCILLHFCCVLLYCVISNGVVVPGGEWAGSIGVLVVVIKEIACCVSAIDGWNVVFVMRGFCC